MTEQQRLGTLVVIAMEARNLSTRDIVGKGDPFVAFHLDGDSKRIKAEKRGGQHPKWDEEVRFSVMKNTSKKMKIQVFNEDKRDPVLIGDATIDLSEVLEKTEWDAWHEINFRNKYSGEVSLEMTFYYDGPPPQKLVHNQPVHSNSLPPQTPQTPAPNSYPNSASHIAPPPVVNKPISAPSAYPPSNVYPPTSTTPNVYPPPNSSNVYPPPSSTAPSNVYHPNSAPSNVYPNSAPSNVYPPNSAPSNVYPPHNSPPQSQPPQFFGPNRTQSPVSSQYPPATSPANVYPPQSQGFPPAYPPISSPPVSSPSFRQVNAPTRHDSGNLAFPIPIPTPMTGNSSYPQSGVYPPSNYPPNNNPYPPNNIYPPVSGGNIYPPPQNTFNHQGYPPNPYPPSGHY